MSLTVTDPHGGTYTTSLRVSTDGINPPLRVDMTTSRGAVTQDNQQVTFNGKIAGGVPPYQARGVFGDGGASSFSDNGLSGEIGPITHRYGSHSAAPFNGSIEVRDSSGMVASRDFQIDAGPVHLDTPGIPIKAVARPRLPYQKRPRQGLCHRHPSTPLVPGSGVKILVDLDKDTPDTLIDTRSPSLGKNLSGTHKLVFYRRPIGTPKGVLDELARSVVSSNQTIPPSAITPITGLELPNQSSLQSAQAVQYGSFSVVRMAVLRLLASGPGGGVVSPSVDLSTPQQFARHSRVAAGPAGNFIAVWRGDHLGGLEGRLVDGDIRFSTGEINRVGGLLAGAVPEVTVSNQGILVPDQYTSWRAQAVTSLKGLATVLWVNKQAATDEIKFQTTIGLPSAQWSGNPPFGSDPNSLALFDVIAPPTGGTVCPIGDSSSPDPLAEWDPGLNQMGLTGDFTIISPSLLPVAVTSLPGGQITVQFGSLLAQVGVGGQISMTGLATVKWLPTAMASTQAFNVPASFSTSLAMVPVSPGADGQFCTPDDSSLPSGLSTLLGQAVDANGDALMVGHMEIPRALGAPVEHLLFEMPLKFSSVALKCGNGVRESPEVCDDGNRLATDGCNNSCQVESGWSCDSNSPSVCICSSGTCTEVCGDGIKTEAESCDDGDSGAGDGCGTTCLVEPGWTCPPGSPSECFETCGNGVVTPFEQCDVGIPQPNDGCSTSCFVEQGWSCQGSPSICSEICGDGILTTSEQCDDGDNDDGDCCSSVCEFEALGSACGDGNTCNGDEQCNAAGGCLPGVALACDDKDRCTIDFCDDLLGCLANPVPLCGEQIPVVSPLGGILLISILLGTGLFLILRRRSPRA